MRLWLMLKYMRSFYFDRGKKKRGQRAPGVEKGGKGLRHFSLKGVNVYISWLFDNFFMKSGSVKGLDWMAVDTCVEIFCGAKILLITVLFLSITDSQCRLVLPILSMDSINISKMTFLLDCSNVNSIAPFFCQFDWPNGLVLDIATVCEKVESKGRTTHNEAC